MCKSNQNHVLNGSHFQMWRIIGNDVSWMGLPSVYGKKQFIEILFKI